MGIIEHVAGDSVYFDTNIFIYTFEGYSEYVPVLKELFRAVEQKQVAVFTSELTIAEVLVKPYSDNNARLVDLYLDAIQSSSYLTLIPVNRQILISAARLRAELGSQMRLPDAIHLSSALSKNCNSFIINDKRLKKMKHIEVVLLADMLV